MLQYQDAIASHPYPPGSPTGRRCRRAISAWISSLAITLLAACGGGGGSSSQPPVSSPVMPTGVVVTAGNHEAMIAWVAVPGATSYNVYRSTSQGSMGTKVGASSTTSYVDSSASNDTTYFYEVTADNAAGEGPVSAQSTGATPTVPVTAPAAPTGLTAASGNAQVSVTWTAISGASSYNVYRSTSQGSQGTKVGSSSTAAYTDTTAINGTSYYYSIAAVNAAGEGSISAQSSAVMPAAPVVVPAAPAGFSATAGDARATVTWTAISGATSYNIYRSTSQGSQGSKIGSSSTASYTDATAANGTTYYYAVTALNAAGEGAVSAQSSGITPTPAATVPAAPTGVNASAGNALVTVSWTAANGATSYNVYRSTAQGTQGARIGIATTQPYADSTVVNGTTYYYEVTAANSAGESPASTQSAPAVPAPSGPAAALAKRLGLPSRLLIGLGSGGADTTLIKTQGLKPDFYERYLVGIGTQGGWTTWNTPSGAYAGYVMADADSVGAVPMFTLFQFSADNLSDMTSLASASYMQTYWADLVTLFNQMNQFGKPVALSVEPDFWGFAQVVTNNTYGGDPTKAPAVLSTDAACAGLPANLTGYAPCLLKLAHKYAPKAVIGFPPSDWGGSSMASVVAFMNQLGTAQGDFIVMQTLDRDAGCPEQAALTPSTAQADCVRGQGSWYWDETNQTHPNFHDNFAMASTFHTGIGGLPIIWWQTPFGVPSATAGGTAGQFRDNRVDYFLKHPSELVAVGGLGVVFGAGAENQTTPATDGGQFQSLSKKYLASPAALP